MLFCVVKQALLHAKIGPFAMQNNGFYNVKALILVFNMSFLYKRECF